MSTFNVKLSLPARWFSEVFAHLYHKSGSFEKWENKSWEIEIIQFAPGELFELDIDLDFKGRDHAGPSITLVLLGFSFDFRITDNRHWNHEENRWFEAGEEAWDHVPELSEADFARAQPATDVFSPEAIQDFKSKSDK
jgi:hypothetical protein